MKKKIKKEKEADERIEKKKINGKVEQMEREQKKKNLVVYNLPESKREEAGEKYREDKEACRKNLKKG